MAQTAQRTRRAAGTRTMPMCFAMAFGLPRSNRRGQMPITSLRADCSPWQPCRYFMRSEEAFAGHRRGDSS